jgi:hypothetical protein
MLIYRQANRDRFLKCDILKTKGMEEMTHKSLKEIRLSKKLTQEEVARKSG